MTSQEALTFIHSHNRPGVAPGLSRVQRLLARLGHPEQNFKCIHIVGTNGKGSTAAMVASMLQAAGLITGLYTSPYLWRFQERMQVNGVPISEEDLVYVTSLVQECAQSMEEAPTEFELVTCMALLYFKQQGCALAVLEAGMGGRRDATNAIPPPEVVAITNIGLDHTDVLGDTVERIAAEKAAVIKAGSQVVVYQQEPAVMEVVTQVCTTQGVPLVVANFEALSTRHNDREGQQFDYGTFQHLKLPLLGAHQQRNAAVALEVILALKRRGWNLPEAAVRQGLETVRWPGRFEVLQRNPWFVVDGGHNPQCAATVAANLDTYFPGEKVVFLVGVMADKDYHGLIEPIGDRAQAFVAVTPDHPRALNAEELAHSLTRYGCPVEVCTSVSQGVERALILAKNGVVCALGSLYMTGAIRAQFCLCVP